MDTKLFARSIRISLGVIPANVTYPPPKRTGANRSPAGMPAPSALPPLTNTIKFKPPTPTAMLVLCPASSQSTCFHMFSGSCGPTIGSVSTSTTSLGSKCSSSLSHLPGFVLLRRDLCQWSLPRHFGSPFLPGWNSNASLPTGASHSSSPFGPPCFGMCVQPFGNPLGFFGRAIFSSPSGSIRPCGLLLQYPNQFPRQLRDP